MAVSEELNEPVRACCDKHPDREAVCENDMRTRALCRECYDEWLRLWRGLQ